MITITRKDLFELVWKTPMSKACIDFQISDVGLKKTCIRNEIPVHPRGHWAKKTAGRAVNEPKLKGPVDAQIMVRGNHGSRLSKDAQEARQKASDFCKQIVVDEKLADPHSQIEALQIVLKIRRPSKDV